MTRPGIWRHWKGGLYRVMFTMHDSTNGSPTEGKLLVCYVSLKTGRMNARSEEQFHERVFIKDGSTFHFNPDVEYGSLSGKLADRFVFLHENPNEQLLEVFEREWQEIKFRRESRKS